MKNSSEPEYTIRGWIGDLRKNGLAKHGYEIRKKASKWKSAFFLGLGFVLLGLFKMWTFREGLTEWWRVVNLSYEEVLKTPYLPIWTSGRGAIGAFFVIVGLCWIRIGLNLKNNKKAEQGGDGDAEEAV